MSIFLKIALARPIETTFRFHSNFWVNLHHCLYHHAFLTKTGISPDLSKLAPDETATWKQAVAYYLKHYVDLFLLDPTMIKINMALAGRAEARTLGGSDLDPALAKVLQGVAPIYRKRFWPEQNRRNHQFIDFLSKLVGEYEEEVKPELVRATRRRGKRVRSTLRLVTT